MEILDIEVARRASNGTSAMKKLRKQGLIPAVIYSQGSESTPLEFGSLYYNRVVAGRPSTQLFKLKSKDGDLNGKLALIKDIQREPIKDVILHIDFLSVRADEKVQVMVRLKLVGEPAVVKLGTAILSHATHDIEVECFPTEIPAVIEVDISDLSLGHSLHARDIVLPPNVTLSSDPDLSIVSAVVKKEEVVQPVAVAAAVPGAEGAVATPEEGKEGDKVKEKE